MLKEYYIQEVAFAGVLWRIYIRYYLQMREAKGGCGRLILYVESTGACNELISCSVSSGPHIYDYRLTLRESYTSS